jgi:hypothetical protein
MGKEAMTSRRAILATLAGAAVGGAGVLQGAAGTRALVCIRLANGADASAIFSSESNGMAIRSRVSQKAYALHPSLIGLERMFTGGSAAILQEDASVTEELGFLQGGYAGPAWMLKAGGVDIRSRAPVASNGLLVLPAKLGAVSGANFPNTAIGRQLRQVAGLLAGQGTQFLAIASMGGPVTKGDPAAQTAGRLAQLDEALTAFYAAVRQLGIERDVTVFTSAATATGRARVVLGGRVAGGEVYPVTGNQQAGVALANWAGYSAGKVLPGASAPSGNFLL